MFYYTYFADFTLTGANGADHMFFYVIMTFSSFWIYCIEIFVFTSAACRDRNITTMQFDCFILVCGCKETNIFFVLHYNIIIYICSVAKTHFLD